MMRTVEWTFEWPDWVPMPVRQEIERFWSYHRGVEDWKKNAQENKAPEFGSVVSLHKLSNDQLCQPGRFVFTWNNIGRVVHEDGSYDYVSFHSIQDDVWRHIL